jgi:hypothetical protein
MVDVGVSNQNLLELEAEFDEPAVNASNLIAWIDDNGLSGLTVAEDGAVAGQRANWEGFQNHASIVLRQALYTSAGLRKVIA